LEFIIKHSRTQFCRLSTNEPVPFTRISVFLPNPRYFRRDLDSPQIVSGPSIFLEKLFSFWHGTANCLIELREFLILFLMASYRNLDSRLNLFVVDVS